MKKMIFAAGALILAPFIPAQAAVIVSATPGTALYSGPTPPTFDFETPATTPVISGGTIRSVNSLPAHQRPFGFSGNYYLVGPSFGQPGNISLASFGLISRITFLWGSVDSNNIVRILDAANNAIATITGTQIRTLMAPNSTPGRQNPLVSIRFTTVAEQAAVNSLELNTVPARNAFEIDNITVRTVSPVPEPSVWAMYGKAGKWNPSSAK